MYGEVQQDLENIKKQRHEIQNNAVTYSDKEKINDLKRLEATILESLQEDKAIGFAIGDLEKEGVSLADVTTMDNDSGIGALARDPSLKQKLQALRKRINNQEKRKKLIRRKMANHSQQNPIGNQEDWDETLDRKQKNQMSLDNMVLRGSYNPRELLPAELKLTEDSKDLKDAKLYNLKIGRNAQDESKMKSKAFTDMEDQLAQELLEKYPYAEGGDPNLHHKSKKDGGKPGSSRGVAIGKDYDPAVQIIMKSMDDEMKGKEEYLLKLLEFSDQTTNEYKGHRTRHLGHVSGARQKEADRREQRLLLMKNNLHSSKMAKKDKKTIGLADSLDEFEMGYQNLLIKMTELNVDHIALKKQEEIDDYTFRKENQILALNFSKSEQDRTKLAKQAESLLNLKRMKLDNEYREQLIEEAKLISENKRTLELEQTKKNNSLLDERINLTKARMDYYSRAALLKRPDPENPSYEKMTLPKKKKKSKKKYLEDNRTDQQSELYLSRNNIEEIEGFASANDTRGISRSKIRCKSFIFMVLLQVLYEQYTNFNLFSSFRKSE